MIRFKKSAFYVVTGVMLLNQPANALDLELYGVGHLSIDRVDNGLDSSTHLTSSSSRLGFRGEHPLKSKLTVIFQYESGVDLTAQGENDGNGDADSKGQIFTKGRPSFVGLKGSFGQALIGHMPALDQWANDYNLFADQVGDLGNLWEGSGIPGRLDNTIQYTSPNMGGFDIAVSYIPEEETDDTDNVILKGNYARKFNDSSLKVGLAHASIGQGKGIDEHTVQALTVGYYFGRFSIGGGYQRESDIKGVSGDDRDSVSFGGSMKITDSGTIKLQLATSDGDADHSDATLMAIGYDHALDDQTTLYMAYARVSNEGSISLSDNDKGFSANGKGHGDKVTPLAGDDPNVFSFGIVYKFDASLL